MIVIQHLAQALLMTEAEEIQLAAKEIR